MPTRNIHNCNLFYEDLGNRNAKETIAFLNGVMASTNSWEKIYLPAIEKGYRVILHDFMGQMKSDKPDREYSFAEHAVMTIELLESLEAKNVHFVGTSYGGEIALKLAIMFPQYPQSLTIIDSVSELDEVLIGFVESWKILIDNCNGEDFFKAVIPSIYGAKYIKANKESLMQRAHLFNKLEDSYPGFFQGQKKLYATFLSDAYQSEYLKEIQCPTLVICGKDDILKPPKFSRIIAQGIKNAELLLLPDCGHVAVFEKPEEITEATLRFIQKTKTENKNGN